MFSLRFQIDRVMQDGRPLWSRRDALMPLPAAVEVKPESVTLIQPSGATVLGFQVGCGQDEPVVIKQEFLWMVHRNP